MDRTSSVNITSLCRLVCFGLVSAEGREGCPDSDRLWMLFSDEGRRQDSQGVGERVPCCLETKGADGVLEPLLCKRRSPQNHHRRGGFHSQGGATLQKPVLGPL